MAHCSSSEMTSPLRCVAPFSDRCDVSLMLNLPPPKLKEVFQTNGAKTEYPIFDER